MTDTIKPLAYRVDYPAGNSVGRARFFGADDSVRMMRHAGSDGIINNLYDQSAIEQARQEGMNLAGEIIADTAKELGCAPDNEVILQSIAELRRQLAAAQRFVATMRQQSHISHLLNTVAR